MEQEIKNGTYTIPEGFAAKIEDGKIVVEKAESEDERIRKEIMDFIYWAIDRGSITNEQRERSDSWLAYLERQKEQKSTVNIDNFKSFMMQYLQDAANRKTDSEIEADTDKWAKKLLNLIEVKEQKPAEIDEYKIIKKHITEDSLSSEVNKRLKECGWYVTDDKPAEWSEEDEKILLSLHHALNCADAQNAIEYTGVEIEEASDWLFNCKGRMTSHWKPSEEQMKWLESAVRLSTNKPHIHGIIISLYEQLKRL